MTSTDSQFAKVYKNLNEAQRQAVDTIEGPVLVLAGPGTGKTQILTARIANILKETDTEPGSILALTFTEAATKEMRTRLIDLTGKDGYFVKISTFHAFCADVIAENPERFSQPSGLQNITDLEKIQIITDILEHNSYTLLKPVTSSLFYVPYILSSLSTLKREGYSLSRYAELVSVQKDQFEIERGELKKTAFLEREKNLNKNLDLLDIYEKYQAKLQELGRFDFEDMINWVVESFETDPDFLLGYQEKFQYLLVDEYQDTNSAQNRLLFALASYWGEEANIFAVGDPNQSIFRFQGASKENVTQFEKTFPRARRVVLTENYRSTNTILSSASALIGGDQLHANASFKNLPHKVVKFTSSIFEDEFIVRTIRRKIKSGTDPQNIAVIVKQNADIDNLVTLFKQRNIPYRLESGVDVLSTPFVSQFIKILRVVTSLQKDLDDLDLFTVLNYPYFGVNPLSVLQTSRLAYQNKKSLADTLLSSRPDLDDHLVDVFMSFVSWGSLSASRTLPEMFQHILQESGLLNHLLNLPQPIVELNRFGTLYEDVKKQSASFPGLDLFGYVRNLSVMVDHHLKLEEQVLLGNEHAVTLTTAHKSKGLEWQTVFVYRFADTHWGNKVNKEMIKLPPGIIRFENLDKEEDKNAEERRLFYVALTRAKQELYLTGAKEYENSARMIFPSLFLRDLPPENLQKLSVKKLEETSQKVLQKLLEPSKVQDLVVGEKEYLADLVKNLKLSPTALNTYLSCPYKFKLDNLYRIPRAKSASLCFGTAVHFALEQLYRDLNNGHFESKEDFLKDFELALQRETLTPAELLSRLEHGRKTLSAYYDFHKEELAPCLSTEKNFGTSLSSQIYLDDIPLSGKVDRIDLVNKAEKKVRVIDYKTGKPKTRNEIEGNTKNSTGDYKRQLIFYDLLSKLDKSFPYTVTETELHFVEPDTKGNFHKERFQITPGDLTTLKKEIRSVVSNIRSLNFPRTNDTDKCATCPFKSHCQR